MYINIQSNRDGPWERLLQRPWKHFCIKAVSGIKGREKSNKLVSDLENHSDIMTSEDLGNWGRDDARSQRETESRDAAMINRLFVCGRCLVGGRQRPRQQYHFPEMSLQYKRFAGLTGCGRCRDKSRLGLEDPIFCLC